MRLSYHATDAGSARTATAAVMRVTLGGCAARGIDRLVAIVVGPRRRDRVSCYGGLIATPNVDRPAADRERPKALGHVPEWQPHRSSIPP